MSVDAATGRSPELTGAYERWTYGPGLAYAGLTLDRSEIRYIPGMVTLPPTALPSDFGRGRSFPGEARLLFSDTTLGAKERSREPTSWPFLLDLGDAPVRDPSLIEVINSTLDRLSEPLRAYLSENGIAGEPAFRLNAPLPPACVNPQGGEVKARPATATQPVSSGSLPVIVAVIDDGIPFSHRNLLDAAGQSTRLDYCWLQGAATDFALPYGRDLTRAEIDALRAAHGPDEDAIYARSGALDILPGRGTPSVNRFGMHGSHIIDAAAGRAPGMAAADIDKIRIVAVQLPPAVTLDTTGFGKDAYFLHALDYIFLCAEEIALAQCGDRKAPLPVVINFSYGYTGGPHDGSSPLERGLRQRVAAREAMGRPTTLVMPSGNSFSSRMHGQIPAAALNGGKPFVIPWRLQPTDLTPSYLEIWLPAVANADNAAAFSLAVTAPTGAIPTTAKPLVFDLAPQATGAVQIDTKILLNGQEIGRFSVEMVNEFWKRVLLALVPTDPADATLPAAPSGRWGIALQKTGGAPLSKPVACRIQRDNDPYGYSRGGRQSVFDDPRDEMFGPDGAPSRTENPPDSFVKRFGTLNGIATHDKVTVVSGFFGDTGRATDYASAGPLRPPGQPPGAGDVHFSAISDDSKALRGARAAGTRSGSSFRLSGTSVAAPRVARKIALGTLPPAPPPPQDPIEAIRLGRKAE